MELSYLAAPEDEGRALKSILRNELRLSTTLLRRLKAANGLTLNGLPAPVNASVRPGDRVCVLLTETPPEYPPEAGPLSVLYEDEFLLVLDKPQGIILHPTHSRFTGTLLNRAWDHILRSGGDGCHAVNRLDRDTGGVVLLAKNAWAHSVLSGAVEEKRYLAAVCGVPEEPSGSVTLPIRRQSETDMKRVCAPDGQSARTDWRLLSVREGLSLLELRLYTGRTHQIRVHCASMGWPLLGDRLYGTAVSLARSQALGIGLQALWCSRMVFPHPLTGELLRLEAGPSAEILSFFDFIP
ncbi:MAG: RluA family pseudouridine synthase [Oscillospiraceae bacterium]|nr:RluA family pseudouridine synthase [Oscillospiraceae bacterium]